MTVVPTSVVFVCPSEEGRRLVSVGARGRRAPVLRPGCSSWWSKGKSNNDIDIDGGWQVVMKNLSFVNGQGDFWKLTRPTKKDYIVHLFFKGIKHLAHCMQKQVSFYIKAGYLSIC